MRRLYTEIRYDSRAVATRTAEEFRRLTSTCKLVELR